MHRLPNADKTTKRTMMYKTELIAGSVQTTTTNSQKRALEIARYRHGNKVAYSLSRDIAVKFEIEARFVKMSIAKNAMNPW